MEQILETLLSGVVGVAGFLGIIYIINKFFVFVKQKTTMNNSLSNDNVSESNDNKKDKEYKSAIPKTMSFICFLFGMIVIQDSENIFVWTLVPLICGVLGYVNTKYYIKKYNSNNN